MEIQWKEVSASDEGGAMSEANEEGCNVGAVFKETERHDGVDGEFPLVEEEEGDDDEAEDD